MNSNRNIFRWFYIFFIIASFLMATAEVLQALPPVKATNPITPDKPLATLKSTLKTAFPPGNLGKAYSYQIETGGKKPVSCKLISGSLPSGLKLSKTGLLAGSPDKAGNFLFSLSVTDRNKQTIKRQVSLSVKRPAVLPDLKPTAGSDKIAVKNKTVAPKFKLLNISLFFSNYTSKATLSSDTKDHRAYAAINVEGSGWIKGYWQLNGKTLAHVKEHLDPTKNFKKKTPAIRTSSSTFKRERSELPSKQPDTPKTITAGTSDLTSLRSGVKRKDISRTKKLLESDYTYLITSPVLPVHPLPGKKAYSLKFIITSPIQKKFSAKATYYVPVADEIKKPPTHVVGQILLVIKDSGNTKKKIKQLAEKYNLDLIKSHQIRSLRQTMAVFRTEKDISTIIKEVKKEKYVVMAQPNNIFRTMSEPMAEMQNIYRTCHLNKLHERYTGKHVTVGIVDTGVDTYHKDLKERIIGHQNFVDNSRYRGEIHGTAVAGIIGADINEFGIAGIAPDVKILALRACKQVSEAHPEGSCQTYAITRALDSAIELGADIVNMSFGSSIGDRLLHNLLEEGTRRGIVFVAPVGNRIEQETLWFPASHKNVIAVAGMDENGNPYPNAEIAAKADVCAPASNLYTTVPGQKHNFLNGTSMSSAVVSGLLAVAHGKNGRINVSQLPVFNGDLCQWEQELVKISLCEE